MSKETCPIAEFSIGLEGLGPQRYRGIRIMTGRHQDQAIERVEVTESDEVFIVNPLRHVALSDQKEAK